MFHWMNCKQELEPTHCLPKRTRRKSPKTQSQGLSNFWVSDKNSFSKCLSKSTTGKIDQTIEMQMPFTCSSSVCLPCTSACEKTTWSTLYSQEADRILLAKRPVSDNHSMMSFKVNLQDKMRIGCRAEQCQDNSVHPPGATDPRQVRKHDLNLWNRFV